MMKKKDKYEVVLEGGSIMTYDQLISMIKRGFEFRLKMKNNIEIGVLSESDLTIFCYVLNTEDERIHIQDIEVKKQNIEQYEIFEYKTLKELFLNKEILIEEL